ncbi:MAG: hypothetical protein A2X25_01015 [Chloroflexi bacterium GWB2_49_20]|nr:MAG: hypothetical protein A2X25_01015 [Chloroflexi bacterium GWB2_49_20]OGN78702.1 MAG: hypothetical protein A2X26_07865 [Chloroflexi bacterium GWC2_49_37]OGN85343.1 MAG: hypothetical protein A2X27_03395 [Chloroflexi bacterium GWD2_49_16]HBG73833.1 hypothetical protein [Anaerolineae bacterium]HCC79423.1 hypothetical protein [Anaerolineae bacterium]
MSKIWKWVLGIVLVLVIIAVLVSIPLRMGGFLRGGVASHGLVQSDGWNGFDQRSPMMGGGYGFDGYHPMMGGRWFAFPMLGFGLLFLRGLIPLALLGLLVYGAFRLGKHRSNPPVSTVAASSEVMAEASVPGASISKTCSNCGGAVQDDWHNCPYCGAKQ